MSSRVCDGLGKICNDCDNISTCMPSHGWGLNVEGTELHVINHCFRLSSSKYLVHLASGAWDTLFACKRHCPAWRYHSRLLICTKSGTKQRSRALTLTLLWEAQYIHVCTCIHMHVSRRGKIQNSKLLMSHTRCRGTKRWLNRCLSFGPKKSART